MNAPLSATGAFGDGASLAIAFAIGIGFGFALERAGFGSAKKLVSQFYLDDLAVFKVMFTAIVTAMVGIWALSRAGVLDLSLVYFVPTHLLPQVVGGLVLGFGFVIGGYCPGTSVVAAATGRLDAMVFLAGVVAGTVAVGEASPWLDRFVDSGDRGTLTLPEVLHLPYGVVVAIVLVMALGAFRGAGWVERRFARPQAAERP